jgi:hypothetical protein
MQIYVHIHIGEDDPVLAALRKLEHHMSNLTDELAVVEGKLTTLQNTTVANNKALLQGLNAIIADLRNNPGDTATALAAAKLLEQHVDTISQTLADDDTANTPQP